VRSCVPPVLTGNRHIWHALKAMGSGRPGALGSRQGWKCMRNYDYVVLV
jgi:hypothetical protein